MGINATKKQKDIEIILNAPEIIAKNKHFKICIAFDEFQEIKNIDPFLIRWMRSVFQNQSNISYVFLGSRQSMMQNIFTDTKSVFYEFAVKMNLKAIRKEDWYDFITKKFKETSVEIEPKLIENIIDKSRCHPHFTQYFASVVWDLIVEGYDPQNPEFDGLWINRIIESQSIIFQNIFDNLNKNQRKILNVLAASNEKTQIFSSSIKEQYNLPINSTLNVSLKSLIKKDIIYKETDHYQIANPVFREWIKRL